MSTSSRIRKGVLVVAVAGGLIASGGVAVAAPMGSGGQGLGPCGQGLGPGAGQGLGPGQGQGLGPGRGLGPGAGQGLGPGRGLGPCGQGAGLVAQDKADGMSPMSSLPPEMMGMMMRMMPNIPTGPIGAVVDVASSIGLGNVPPAIFAGMYAEVNNAREAEGLATLKPCPFATNHAMNDARARAAGETYQYPAMGGFKVLTYRGDAISAKAIFAQWLSTTEGKDAIYSGSTMQGVGVADNSDGTITVVLAVH